MYHRLIILATALISTSEAEIFLAPPFTDHMVFQRGKVIPVWGSAGSKQEVTVEFAGQKKSTTSDAKGAWLLNLNPMKASADGRVLTVHAGDDFLRVKDLLVGDVWVATGQSNMRWMLKQCVGGKAEVAVSADPGLRLFNHAGTLHPDGKKYSVDFLKKMTTENYYATRGWQRSSPTSSAGFSGVAYFFGKKLRRELNVPIGIINYSVGGTPIEAHISPEVFQAHPLLKPLLKKWWRNNEFPQWCRQRAALNLTHWLNDPKLKGQSPPHPFAPHFLWDAGIGRLLPLPVKGVIWYQGESNATTDGDRSAAVMGDLNKQKFKALVKSWRNAWSDEKLPVYYVQLPSLNRQWPLFREMQLEASRELKNVGMAVSIDVGHPTNVHPPNKKPVGDRLARLALAGTYGKVIVPNGPIYKRSLFKGPEVVIEFENGTGMKASSGKKIRGFEIAGRDKKFHLAQVAPEGGYLNVSSKDVSRPVAVRYAWANDPDCNLVNKEGLPASPFRTDRWENIKPSGNVDRHGKYPH